jgi:polysaccharide pyruvyl transferase WcaK-like protein
MTSTRVRGVGDEPAGRTRHRLPSSTDRLVDIREPLSALAGVTFAPLPYASKVEGLVHELGIPSLPIQDLTVGRLLARIDHAWDMRDELRDRVTERLPLLRQRAARTAEMATTLVSSAAVTNP